MNTDLARYRFNINDFTHDQVDQLIASCLKLGGNKPCKKKLQKAVANQRKEKARYYRFIGNERIKRHRNERVVQWMKNLHLPERFISKLVRTSYECNQPQQYTYWERPESEQSMILRNFSRAEALAGLQPGSAELSGFERLKRSFFPAYFVPNYSPNEYSHLYNLKTLMNFVFGPSAVVGLILAVSYGTRYVADFDRTNGSNLYESKQDAHRARHSAFFKGYTRYAFRWGWRIAFLVGSFAFISQALCIYTLKDRMSHYVLGGMVPFSLYKWTRGPKGMLVTGTVGTLFFGVPIGFVLGTLGANPRPITYDGHAQPELSSPHHWYNWTEEQKQRSNTLLNHLLRELHKVYFDENELENRQIYDVLFSPLPGVSND